MPLWRTNAEIDRNRVREGPLHTAVDRVENDRGGGFLPASPLKAVADYVYVHKRDWTSLEVWSRAFFLAQCDKLG